MKTLSRNQNIAWQLLKALIVAASLWFIWMKVANRAGEESFIDLTGRVLADPGSTQLLSVVVLMMFLNWGIEALKWKRLLKPFYSISLIRAFGAVLSGTTVSLFTPNRIGEFAGRVLHLEPGFRIKGIIATITGSMSQLLVTIVAGAIALVLSMDESGLFQQTPSRMLVAMVVVVPSAAIILFFKLPSLVKWIRNEKWRRNFVALTAYSPLHLVLVTFLSAIRYLVFAIQFYLVLDMFGITMPFFTALQLIAIIYLVMSVVPTMAISEITVRGSVALYILAPHTGDSVAVLSASTLLWLVNLAIPAILGALSAFWFRFTR